MDVAFSFWSPCVCVPAKNFSAPENVGWIFGGAVATQWRLRPGKQDHSQDLVRGLHTGLVGSENVWQAFAIIEIVPWHRIQLTFMQMKLRDCSRFVSGSRSSRSSSSKSKTLIFIYRSELSAASNKGGQSRDGGREIGNNTASHIFIT